MSAWDAVARLADQIGWSLRFRWHSASAAWRLTFTQPDRSKSTADRVFALGDEVEVTESALSLFDVRNVVRVTYGDASVRSPEGRPTRRTVIATDSASIAKYGRRFMEVQEADSSNIDSSTEANALASAILSDLKEPLVTVGYRTAVDPFVELEDVVELPSDGVRWFSAQRLAVDGFVHRFDANGADTLLRLRGKPASRRRGWQQKDTRANSDDQHMLSLANAVNFTLSTREIVGGTRIRIDQDLVQGALARAYEYHVSDTPSFSVSAGTLVNATRATEVVVPELVPGKTYYARVVPYSENGERIVRGEPSAEVSFVAGRAKAGHYDSLSVQAHLPLNGNFEHASDSLANAPPDHWSVVSGKWGSSGDLFWGNDAVYGNFISLRQTAGDPLLRSSAFPVRRAGGRFNVYLSVRPQGTLTATRRLMVYVRFYRKSDLSDVPILFTYRVPHDIAAAGSWASTVIDSQFFGAVPFNVNFATITFGKEDLSNLYGWDVGDVFFCEAQQEDLWATSRLFSPTIYGGSTSLQTTLFQESWTAPAFNAGWGNYGSGWQTAAYMKDSLGFVHLRGLTRRTSGSETTIFTLPAGFRPAAQKIFAVDSNGAHARIDVTSGGAVVLSGGSPTAWVSLEGITFDTRS